ncbi:MAG: class I SAM-dependent methyltransferase [Planctomycetota bacterium]
MNDDWSPLEPEQHDAQLAAVRTLLPDRARVLDLGAGNGRMASPLARDGHDVIAFERDARAIDALSAAPIRAIHADFLDQHAWSALPDPFDAALCLGNTWLEVTDALDALTLARRVRTRLAPGGFFAIDCFVYETWRDVAEGNWQEGLSEDGSAQLVWGEGDAIIAWRTGDAVDPESWGLGASDRPVRLWDLGALRLLAHAAGFSDPEIRAGDHLILLRPAIGAPHPPENS